MMEPGNAGKSHDLTARWRFDDAPDGRVVEVGAAVTGESAPSVEAAHAGTCTRLPIPLQINTSPPRHERLRNSPHRVTCATEERAVRPRLGLRLSFFASSGCAINRSWIFPVGLLAHDAT
jgi:hypothetical protein